MRLYLVLLCSVFMGCSLLKSDRHDIIPEAPRPNYKQSEVIQEQAKVNYDLARWIRENGVTPNSERAILLEDGSEVILRYVGHPYKKIDTNDLKANKKVTEKASDVATTFQKDSSKYDDALDKYRESLIKKTNLKWDLGKIFGFGLTTWIIIIIAIPVLCALFPVIIPVVSIVFQLFKAGIGAFAVVAKFGVSGLVNVVKSIETFREKHKGTEIGKTLDEHLLTNLDSKDKTTLDKLKNFFHI